MWLRPIGLNWKSKAIRLVSHVARHDHRIRYTRHGWGDLSPSSDGLSSLRRFVHFQDTAVWMILNPTCLAKDIFEVGPLTPQKKGRV